jgi:hypothetical protein
VFNILISAVGAARRAECSCLPQPFPFLYVRRDVIRELPELQLKKASHYCTTLIDWF